MNHAERIVKENPAIGRDALEFMDSLLTTEEIAESNLRVALIGMTASIATNCTPSEGEVQ